MSKPRICIAISTFYPIVGGAERQALLQARSLITLGYSVMVLTFRQKLAWSASEQVDGVPVQRIAGRFLSGREQHSNLVKRCRYFIGLCMLGWTLWRMRSSYDILHVYHLNLFALPAAFVAFITRKPLLIGVRSASTAEAGADTRRSGMLQPRLHHSSQIGGDLNDLERLGPLMVSFMHFLLLHSNTVVTVLSSRMRLYLEAHQFSLPHIILIPNGVDTERFVPAATTFAKETVVCVSKLCYRKGSDILMQAWAMVHQECPEALLCLVGDGPLLSELKQMSSNLNLTGAVEFIGLQKDIPAQLHTASIAVLPSRLEGMPNALLEAMACGLACVATRVSGSEDIIQHGLNGLLVEPEDAVGLAQALIFLLQNPEQTRQYGRAAHAHIIEHYANTQVMTTYLKLYHDLLDERFFATTRRPRQHVFLALRRNIGRMVRCVWNFRLY